MAVLYNTNGQIVNLITDVTQGGILTIADIIVTLGGPVDVTLMQDIWIFTHKFSVNLEFPPNHIATYRYSMPIFGPCVVAESDELSNHFFVPEKSVLDELLDELYDYTSTVYGINKEIIAMRIERGEIPTRTKTMPKTIDEPAERVEFKTIHELNKYILESIDFLKGVDNTILQSDLDSDEIFKRRIDFIDSVVSNILNNRDAFVYGTTGFVLHEADMNMIVLPDNNTMRCEFINSIINFYKEHELYEQCAELYKIVQELTQKDSN